MSAPSELFFSHAHQDAAEAQSLIEVLRRHGVPVWYAPQQILGAQQWHDEIGKALERCDWFLVLLSPHSVASRWVKLEFLHALDSAASENHILPVVLEKCDQAKLSWTLPLLQQVTLTNNRLAGYREILRTWGIGYRP